MACTGSRRVRSWVVGAAFAALGVAAAPAQASTFWLGDVSSPKTLSWSRSGLLGPFDDHLLFTVTSSQPLVFSGFVSTGISRRSFILDMEGDLLQSDGSVLEAGDAQTVFTPEGWPSRDISFASFSLASGSYVLRIHGTETSAFPDVPITGQYTGTVSFAPVPEVQTWAMLLVGLAAVGWLRAWRGKTR
ncbi:hypothetical protein DZC73_12890 [Albitalea terrae]|uniref:PEP-CTERM sorting domain-containing protein n=2 Tax=Piscinibacter terrae TaxID=2496871 RepID=A0A3N7JTD4_9BURK|nr:hypothetical protein DZC73_12890 [Albitalea terrae]